MSSYVEYSKWTELKEPKYFSLEEMIRSDTARVKMIDNIPSWEGVRKLNWFANVYIDPIRERLGKALNITSGYRCSELNVAVGGSATSHHCKYEAVDLQLVSDRSKTGAELIYNTVKAWTIETGNKIDQCFLERSASTGKWWCHLGIGGNWRNEFKEIVAK